MTIAELPSDKLVAGVIAAVWTVCLLVIVACLVLPYLQKAARLHLRWTVAQRLGNWLKARARWPS